MNAATSHKSPVARSAFRWVALLLATSLPVHLAAQTEAAVNRLAPILAAEDARDFNEGLLAGALADPDSIVARTAIRAIGRIGDPSGIPLLLGVFDRPPVADLQAEAAFGLGLIRDSAAVPGLIDWLRRRDVVPATAVTEGITALAKIGGPAAAAFLAQVLADPTTIPGDTTHTAVRVAVGEAWRLGRRAPVAALVAATGDTATRRAAVYSLVRLRAKEAATVLIALSAIPDQQVRQDATRALTKGYARDAGIPASTVVAALRPRLGDTDVGTRINALRGIGSFADSTLVPLVVPLLNDPLSGVQITAVTTLGLLGGTAAVEPLQRTLAGRRDWAVRREALLALARIDRTAFHAAVTPWAASGDWRDRAAAAEGAGRGSPAELTPFLTDHDPRVVETALQTWAAGVEGPDPELLRVARADLDRPDAMVRSVSADILGRAAAGSDVPGLAHAWRRAQRDSFPDAALSALGALRAVAQGADSATVAPFAGTEPAPADPLLREWAEAHWPALASRWGSSRPIATGRSLDDYRDLARRYLVGPDSLASPRVVIEIADRGNVPVRLFGADAPLTVDNFLRLVDRHYFDGLRWHRVVPNFVVQAGDPRGDGSGGPGWAIRDEINRQRYYPGYLGMALSGPNTGGSQWFITLSAQPHLDGTYAVFGRITGGDAILAKVAQGDVIRSIHR